jgi:hemerythrin-like domain-containing protein
MFVTAWDTEIAGHFHDEEHLLVDLMQDQDRQRLLDEHAKIMRYAIHASKLRSMLDPDVTTVRQIGRSLRQHIRWEELELYVHLQEQLSEEALADLQQQTQAVEATRHRSY